MNDRPISVGGSADGLPTEDTTVERLQRELRAYEVTVTNLQAEYRQLSAAIVRVTGEVMAALDDHNAASAAFRLGQFRGYLDATKEATSWP